MNPGISPVESRPTRGRWQLLLIVAVVLGPMVLAACMYQYGFWVPESRSYDGELIGNGLGREDLGVTATAEPRWQLLVTAPQECDEPCRRMVYLARQINIGLGREADRASHALASARPLATDYQQQLQREYPQLRHYPLDADVYGREVPAPVPQLWIVDPHGNLVLRYGAEAQGKAILDDLRYLLKISQIG